MQNNPPPPKKKEREKEKEKESHIASFPTNFNQLTTLIVRQVQKDNARKNEIYHKEKKEKARPWVG